MKFSFAPWRQPNNSFKPTPLRGVLLFLVAVPLVAGAGDTAGYTLVRPPDTAKWTVTAFQTEQGLFAHFSGSAWVNGTLVATWVRGVDSETLNEVRVKILLDSTSVAMLPTFSNPKFPQIGPDGELEIVNVEDALRMSFSPKQLSQFQEQRIVVLRADASFLIGTYKLSGDCDHLWASATLVNVKAPRLLTADNRTIGAGCG